MSRCFPFPPPGYEKKARTDDVDLLNKEKQKEKKEKKEKRDKKKEGKDKKDKERSKDKDREKKERKEKHKDKDKKKSKDKKKTDEKKIEGQPDGSNGGKHCEAEANKDTKFVEIGRRIADEERGRGDKMVESLPGSDPRKVDGVAKLGEKYHDSKFQERENNKDKEKTDRQRIKNEGRIIGNAVVSNFPGVEQRRDGENTVVSSFPGVEQRRDGGNTVVSSFPGVEQRRDGGNTVVSSFPGVEQRRDGGPARPMEKDSERKMEGKEKDKDQEGKNKQEVKRKHRDGEKKSKEKKSKEKKTTEKEKLKEKVKHENRKHDKMIEVPKDRINTLNIKPIQIPKDSGKSASTEENLRKRKDCETNGFLHVESPTLYHGSTVSTPLLPPNNVLLNKLPRPTLSSHLPSLNGRKSELCQPATQFASVMHGGASNIRFDSKVLKVNGLLPVQPSPISSTSPLIPVVQARENGEASKKPPHPDSKYLSKILSVPKMDDWSDFDDQEWLFNSDSVQLKKPKTVSSGVDGSPQVWDRALRIDSADVCALPYVIPY